MRIVAGYFGTQVTSLLCMEVTHNPLATCTAGSLLIVQPGSRNYNWSVILVPSRSTLYSHSCRLVALRAPIAVFGVWPQQRSVAALLDMAMPLWSFALVKRTGRWHYWMRQLHREWRNRKKVGVLRHFNRSTSLSPPNLLLQPVLTKLVLHQ